MKWVVLRCFGTSRTILNTKGAANRFLGDMSSDIPMYIFFGTVFVTLAVWDD